MDSHLDSDFERGLRNQRAAEQTEYLKRLEQRADEIRERGGSNITGGTPGEKPLAEWIANGVHVKRLPDDEQKILRISIGGAETPVELKYCVFRGDREECIKLLRSALAALGHPRGANE